MDNIHKAYAWATAVAPSYAITQAYKDHVADLSDIAIISNEYMGLIAALAAGGMTLKQYTSYLKNNKNDEIMHILGILGSGFASAFTTCALADSCDGHEFSSFRDDNNGNPVSTTETKSIKPFAGRTLPNGQAITFG